MITQYTVKYSSDPNFVSVLPLGCNHLDWLRLTYVAL